MKYASVQKNSSALKSLVISEIFWQIQNKKKWKIISLDTEWDGIWLYDHR